MSRSLRLQHSGSEDVVEEVGGFDGDFTRVAKNEDQASYFNVGLCVPVMALSVIWDMYRHYSGSGMAPSLRTGQEDKERNCFLGWLKELLCERDIHDVQVWVALNIELWLMNSPPGLPLLERTQRIHKQSKRWFLDWRTSPRRYSPHTGRIVPERAEELIRQY